MTILANADGGLTIILSREDVSSALLPDNNSRKDVVDPLSKLHTHTLAFFKDLRETFGTTSFEQKDPLFVEARRKHGIFDVTARIKRMVAIGMMEKTPLGNNNNLLRFTE